MNRLIGSVLGGLLGIWIGDLVLKHAPGLPEGPLAHKMIEGGITIAGAATGYLLAPTEAAPAPGGTLVTINAGKPPAV
jgi:hypothetical protein